MEVVSRGLGEGLGWLSGFLEEVNEGLPEGARVDRVELYALFALAVFLACELSLCCARARQSEAAQPVETEEDLSEEERERL